MKASVLAPLLDFYFDNRRRRAATFSSASESESEDMLTTFCIRKVAQDSKCNCDVLVQIVDDHKPASIGDHIAIV